MTLEEPFVPAEAGAGAPSHSHAIPGHPAGYSGEGALQPVMGLGQADSLMLNGEASCMLLRLGEGLMMNKLRSWKFYSVELLLALFA